MGPGDGGHEGRRRGDAAGRPRPAPSRAATSPSCSTRPRRSTRGTTGSCTSSSSARAHRRRRLRRAPRAHRRPGGGRLQGPLRAEVTTKGIAAHSARPWKGHNAIHDAGEILSRLVAYEPVTHVVDELEFREALNAVLVSGASPPTSSRTGASSRSTTATHPRCPRRMPRRTSARSSPASTSTSSTTPVVPDPGCTCRRRRPSSRRSACPSRPSRAGPTSPDSPRSGVPAVNFGPGDPNLAHMDDERCPVEQYTACEAALLTCPLGCPPGSP